MPIVEDDGTVVYTDQELSNEAVFAAMLLQAMSDMGAFQEREKRPPARPGEVPNMDEFVVRFLRTFREPFPGTPDRWLPYYKKGLDTLVELGLAEDVRRGTLPGAATATELWVPRVVHFDRIRQGVFVLKEG